MQLPSAEAPLVTRMLEQAWDSIPLSRARLAAAIVMMYLDLIFVVLL